LKLEIFPNLCNTRGTNIAVLRTEVIFVLKIPK